ncbi:MAG: class I SAM-dependent methyltransferase [Candidatus Rokubacteria bacterium]|nr:class I SAM-dependent methyltransferase [Candidatus Rokubacteria bacterium]MBI3109128.1 class I SAM-dependent methyltransferase [Candidatus Rokubacteria bacterium]
MGFYARHVLPRLIDVAMRSRDAMAERGKLVPRATGAVLEVGVGSGLNLALYAPTVERVYGLDPSPELQRMARCRAERAGVPARFLIASAEAVPLPDRSVDTVVSTWTLCSIPDPARALAEIRRVLRPGGRFIFIEHGRSPDAPVLAWQERLNPIWQRIAGGCHLNRSIDLLVVASGFRITEIKRGYSRGPRPFTYLYKGLGVRS